MRFVPAANLHVTVQFLGEVAEERAAELEGALRARVAPLAPFALELERIAPGPPGGRARMVWAHFARSPDFERLARAVAEAAAPYAPKLEPPRQALPHATLARFGRPPPRLRDLVLPQLAGSVHVPACQLVRSRLSPKGSIYTVLAELPLRGELSRPA